MAQTIGDSTLLDAWASSGDIVEPDLSKIEQGWLLGEQPPHEFFNWIQNTFGQKINHVLQRGVSSHDAAKTYAVGDVVGSGGSVWIAQAINTNSTPGPSNTDWVRVITADDVATTTDAGIVELATDAETIAGTSSTLATTPSGVSAAIAESQSIVGSYLYLQDDLVGADEPDPNFYVKLTAGESGVGQYNEGKLTNEVVSGSAPLVDATAQISDATSPLNGQTVHLINSENRYLMPGETGGSVANDQMQQITGLTAGGTSNFPAQGAFTNLGDQMIGYQGGTNSLFQGDFDSANSPNARTGDHTNVKHLQTTVYMRIR